MPYIIRPYQTGYRVYSESGTPLSHKPLSAEMAKKQKVAATLSMLRRRGELRGGGGGSIGYPLSETDIQQLLGGTSVLRYPELEGMSSINEALDDAGRCIILYLTQNADTGHWVSLLKRGDKTIEYFDPYGGYKPDGERKWLSEAKLKELGQDEPILTRLLKGYKVISNPYHFQKEGGDVNTCGRHCCMRLISAKLSLPEYKAMIESSGVPADEFVTLTTSQILNK